MGEVSHTPGPLKVRSDDYGHVILSEAGNLITDYLEESENDEGDAHRLTDCWNACDGLADPSVVPELVEALEPFAEFLKLALEGHTPGFSKSRGREHVVISWNGADCTLGMLEDARALVAKARGVAS